MTIPAPGSVSEVEQEQGREGQDLSQFEDSSEPVPAMQKVLDNPFLLLFIGVVMPTVFYIIWGIMEIVTIPLAK